jgi:hypothetical protein
MSQIAKVWFEEAKKLKVDQAIFLRVANKSEQIDLANALEKEKDKFAELDSVLASQLFINKVLKALKQYVVIERKYRTPFTAFFKDETGEMSKITVDPERGRIIRLMVKDGKSKEEIEETLNGLTDEEIQDFCL